MAGERILIVDSSVAVQEVTKNVLEEGGYKVIVASNALGALSYPKIQEVDLFILDVTSEGVDGFEAARVLKTDSDTFCVPVLLLVPEESYTTRADFSLRGANGYLVKPFRPSELLHKVLSLLEEQEIQEKSKKYLEEAANKFMERLAESYIQEAVERKTQIIVERSVQNIISLIDQRARKEVDARVTSLTAEKEQELVKMTVHEVARSMVEKLAERKVAEAMESILAEQTEKAVRRVADSLLPTLIRERVKETLDHVLPREVQTRVQRAADGLVPEISDKIVSMIDGIAQKIVPKVAREKVPEYVEKRLATTLDATVPQTVRETTRREVDDQLATKIDPIIRDATRRIRSRSAWIMLFVLLVVLAGLGWQIYLSFFATK
jgi:twitching motility two-component system response regulator PilH